MSDSDGSKSRRQFLEQAGTATAGAALAAMAGCSSGGDSSSGGGEGGSGGSETSTESGGGTGGGSESVTVTFWSFLAAENAKTGDHFKSSMKNFEEKKSNIKVNLQALNSQDLTSKISSTVNSGNAPDLSEHGSAGLNFHFNDQAADHGAYFEETGLAEEYTQANVDSAKFRGNFWTGGGNRHLTSLLSVRPKFFKEVGVSDPSGLKTWTDFRRALEKIGEKHSNVHPYEETGVYNDLESYWGQARTAYTDGEDPWIDGDPTDPNVKPGNNPRTDGMIKNCVDLARTYSSSESASRGDEEVPSLMLTDRAASFTYGLGSPIRYESVKKDVTFGWNGDIWQGPNPKLDPNYGNEFGIDELAGKEGQHGGHLWALEFMKQVMSQSDVKDAAFELLTYTNTSEDHNLKLLTDFYPATSSYKPLNKKIINQMSGDLPQIQKMIYEMPKKYGTQYNTTGAPWDVRGTDKIRWRDINETISQGIAGQHDVSETPGLIRDRIQTTLKKQNS